MGSSEWLDDWFERHQREMTRASGELAMLVLSGVVHGEDDTVTDAVLHARTVTLQGALCGMASWLAQVLETFGEEARDAWLEEVGRALAAGVGEPPA